MDDLSTWKYLKVRWRRRGAVGRRGQKQKWRRKGFPILGTMIETKEREGNVVTPKEGSSSSFGKKTKLKEKSDPIS